MHDNSLLNGGKKMFGQILKSSNHHIDCITKADKDFARRGDVKDKQFPVKIRDIHKIGRKKFVGISLFGY